MQKYIGIKIIILIIIIIIINNNEFYRFIFMECGMRFEYTFYETVILFVIIKKTNEEAILLDKLMHTLLMRKRSVVLDL